MILPKAPRAARAARRTRCASSSRRPTASSRHPSAASWACRTCIASDIEEVDGVLHRQAARHALLPRGQDHARRPSGSRGAARCSRDFTESWFYSDSLNDIPLLERVTHPVAVDPDATLRSACARSAAGRSSRLQGRHDQEVHRPASSAAASASPHKDARPVIYGTDKHDIRTRARSAAARGAPARSCSARATRPSWWAARCATCCSAACPRTSTSPPAPRPRRCARSSAARASSGGASRSCTCCAARTWWRSRPSARTFTREPDDDNTDEHGRMLSDNVFGTQAEDALRRDFTVNALFYDPVKEEVWDYVHGVKDLQAKKLVMIGDAGDALPRGPGAHAARRAPRREARARRSTRRPRRRSTRCKHLHRERPAGAALRGDPEAAALGQRRRRACSCCASWSCTTACCRCSTTRSRIPRHGPLRDGRAARHRRAPAPPTSRCRPRSCSPRSSGAACEKSLQAVRGRRASRRSRRCTPRCTRRSTRSASRSPSRGASTRP